MKKWQIWLVGCFMMVALGGLLWMQFTYLDKMTVMRNQQFSEAVSRSLYEVSQELQRQETRKFLEAELLRGTGVVQPKDGKSPKDASWFYQERVYSSESADGSVQSTLEVYEQQASPNVILSPKHGENNILSTSKKLQFELKERYLYQKELLDAVILEILERSELKPLLERVDPVMLRTVIRSELQNNGINLRFTYQVVNSRDKVHYSSVDERAFQTENEVFTQIIFPNDRPSQCYSIKVAFPEKRAYIFSTIRFMIPSFLFTMILSVTFALMLWMMLRQKRVTEMRTDFVNNMTHEFKTPVSTISLAAQMLNEPAVASSPRMLQHVSRVIGDETKRLSFQVDKVLQMSMFDREKAVLKRQRLDMNKLIEGVVNTFKLKVETSEGGRLTTALNAENPYVEVDEMHITNVVFNLLDNAVKYAQSEVPIVLNITTHNESGRLVLSVKDNGIGMSKEYVKKIFDRFYRIPKGNVHNVKGFGLGLAYVKKIVADHGGKIKVESELNQGTRFIISIPSSEAPTDDVERIY